MAEVIGHDARAVSNYCLDRCEAYGRSVTHVALHKILYFLQGWHLAFNQEPLIKNPIEAWKSGPVIKVVYDEFREVPKFSQITTRALVYDYITGQKKLAAANLVNSQLDLTNNVIDIYSNIPPSSLVEMTHETGSPWDQVWNREGGAPTVGMRISNAVIESHFLTSPQHIEIN